MIYLNGQPAVGFSDSSAAASPIERTDRALPPLELRTATVKGLGIGAGGLIGFLAFGPLGLVLLGLAGWQVGNQIAVKAERSFVGGNG